MIQRETYMERLYGFKDKHLIKIVTGVRRCGKSTLLEMFRDRLKQEGIQDEQILWLNFEDFALSDLTDPRRLHEHVLANMASEGKTYVFLDEIQMVKDFPRVVDSLFLRRNLDLYLTGSNACLLSHEIATLLSGRYVEVPMLPLSFREVVDYQGNRTELSRKYADYLRFSSFPYALELDGSQRKIDDYLAGIYHAVLIKDIVTRLGSAEVLLIESLVKFLFDNIGSLFSIKRIADTLTAEGRKISAPSVEKYLDALTDSYVMYRASRYDVKGRQHLKLNEKIYACDMGLRAWLLGRRASDVGHVLENVVYLELRRRGFDVYVGRLDAWEVDFVALRNGLPEYFQVTASIRDQAVFEREVRPLEKIADHYPKWLLHLDEDAPADHNGIRCMNALEYLLR